MVHPFSTLSMEIILCGSQNIDHMITYLLRLWGVSKQDRTRYIVCSPLTHSIRLSGGYQLDSVWKWRTYVWRPTVENIDLVNHISYAWTASNPSSFTQIAKYSLTICPLHSLDISRMSTISNNLILRQSKITYVYIYIQYIL